MYLFLLQVIIREHRSTTVRPIITDGVAWYICRSICWTVCQSVTIVSPAKTAEPIEMPSGLWT